MKIFNRTQNWLDKVNFVDDNNVLVGYDITQLCCEHADWFIIDRPQTEIPSCLEAVQPTDLPGWCFDKHYFKQDESTGTNFAIFRLTKGDEELFLHLFNCHNGYYSHGFEFESANNIINKGYL